MLCLYSALPLGWIMKAMVRGTLFRHLYATILGVFIQYFMYREQFIHPFIMATVTYLLMNFLPRNKVHIYAMIFAMLYLSGQHIYRMITNFGGWEMDVTTFTMLLTARMWSIGFCYKDGAIKDEDLMPE